MRSVGSGIIGYTEENVIYFQNGSFERLSCRNKDAPPKGGIENDGSGMTVPDSASTEQILESDSLGDSAGQVGGGMPPAKVRIPDIEQGP